MKKSALTDIYFGNFCAESIQPTAREKELLRKTVEKETELRNLCRENSEIWKLYNQVDELSGEMIAEIRLSTFCEAMAFGIRLAAEAVSRGEEND